MACFINENSSQESPNRLDTPESYFLYFVLTLVATCYGWVCWSHSCGFVVMGCPKVLFLAAFLLLLSFWVDLCHQANDEDEEDEGCSPQEPLLEKRNKPHSNTSSQRRCCSFRVFHVGSRQKIVILVAGLAIVSVICFTSSAFVALISKVPMIYDPEQQNSSVVYTFLLLIVYNFIGKCVHFLLHIMGNDYQLLVLALDMLRQFSLIQYVLSAW